jgi:hypothetical protein
VAPTKGLRNGDGARQVADRTTQASPKPVFKKWFAALLLFGPQSLVRQTDVLCIRKTI